MTSLNRSVVSAGRESLFQVYYSFVSSNQIRTLKSETPSSASSIQKCFFLLSVKTFTRGLPPNPSPRAPFLRRRFPARNSLLRLLPSMRLRLPTLLLLLLLPLLLPSLHLPQGPSASTRQRTWTARRYRNSRSSVPRLDSKSVGTRPNFALVFSANRNLRNLPKLRVSRAER